MNAYTAYPYSRARAIVFSILYFLIGTVIFGKFFDLDNMRLRYFCLCMLVVAIVAYLLANFSSKGKVTIEIQDDGFYLKWLQQNVFRFQSKKEDVLIPYGDIKKFRHGNSKIDGKFIRMTLNDGTRYNLCEQQIPFVKAQDFDGLISELGLKFETYIPGPIAPAAKPLSPSLSQKHEELSVPAGTETQNTKSRGTKIAMRLLILYLSAFTIVTGSIMVFVVQPRKDASQTVKTVKVLCILGLLFCSLVGTKFIFRKLTRLAVKIDEEDKKKE